MSQKKEPTHDVVSVSGHSSSEPTSFNKFSQRSKDVVEKHNFDSIADRLAQLTLCSTPDRGKRSELTSPEEDRVHLKARYKTYGKLLADQARRFPGYFQLSDVDNENEDQALKLARMLANKKEG